MYERASPEAPLRGSKTTNTSQLPPPHRVQTTRANAQQRRRVASRRIASPKRHRASSDSHRGTHLRRESPAIANNIQTNLKMSEDEDEFEAEERRKDEAGAKAAQELADKQLRHLNKKVREDPTYPNICTSLDRGNSLSNCPFRKVNKYLHFVGFTFSVNFMFCWFALLYPIFFSGKSRKFNQKNTWQDLLQE